LTEDERLAHQTFIAKNLPDTALWRSGAPAGS
jgi:hypothetical protein